MLQGTVGIGYIYSRGKGQSEAPPQFDAVRWAACQLQVGWFVHLERWLSGRKHIIANDATGLNWSAGSNPVLSACFSWANRFLALTLDRAWD